MLDNKIKSKEGTDESYILTGGNCDNANDDNYFCDKEVTSSPNNNKEMELAGNFDNPANKLGATTVDKSTEPRKERMNTSKENAVVQSVLGRGYREKLAKWYDELKRIRESDKTGWGRLRWLGIGGSSRDFLRVFNTVKQLLKVLIKVNTNENKGEKADEQLKQTLRVLLSELSQACKKYLDKHKEKDKKKNRYEKRKVIGEIQVWAEHCKDEDYVCRYNAMDELSEQLGIEEEERHWKTPWRIEKDPEKIVADEKYKKTVDTWIRDSYNFLIDNDVRQHSSDPVPDKTKGQTENPDISYDRELRTTANWENSKNLDPLVDTFDFVAQQGLCKVKSDKILGEISKGIYGGLGGEPDFQGLQNAEAITEVITQLEEHDYFKKTNIRERYQTMIKDCESTYNKYKTQSQSTPDQMNKDNRAIIKFIMYLLSPYQCHVPNLNNITSEEKPKFVKMVKAISQLAGPLFAFAALYSGRLAEGSVSQHSKIPKKKKKG